MITVIQIDLVPLSWTKNSQKIHTFVIIYCTSTIPLYGSERSLYQYWCMYEFYDKKRLQSFSSTTIPDTIPYFLGFGIIRCHWRIIGGSKFFETNGRINLLSYRSWELRLFRLFPTSHLNKKINFKIFINICL